MQAGVGVCWKRKKTEREKTKQIKHKTKKTFISLMMICRQMLALLGKKEEKERDNKKQKNKNKQNKPS